MDFYNTDDMRQEGSLSSEHTENSVCNSYLTFSLPAHLNTRVDEVTSSVFSLIGSSSQVRLLLHGQQLSNCH